MEDSTIVENWLRSLDLVYYTQSFLDNGYDDLEICKHVGDDDLNAIGVTDPLHRAQILEAVRKLQEQGGTAVYFTLEAPIYEEYTIVGVNVSPTTARSTKPVVGGDDAGGHEDLRPACDGPGPEREAAWGGGGGPSSGSSATDAYGEGKRALVTYPRLQLTNIIRDKLMGDGVNLDKQNATAELAHKLVQLAHKYALELHTHVNDVLDELRDVILTKSGILHQEALLESNYADITTAPGDTTNDSEQSIRVTTVGPGNDDYQELVDGDTNNKKKTPGIARFFKNVVGMTSGRKFTYRKHEGDLNASEITMADEQRIELMLLVKEGKISMHDAVERVKAYERQHRSAEKTGPERDDHRQSPQHQGVWLQPGAVFRSVVSGKPIPSLLQLPALLRRKSQDSRSSSQDGRSQDSPRSKKSSSSTESSPHQRSRSRSGPRAYCDSIDLCPEEQLVVEVSHPSGTSSSNSGGASDISITVKPLGDKSTSSSQKHKSKKNGRSSSSQQEEQSAPVLCATPMCWMSPKRHRKYVSSSPENTLPRQSGATTKQQPQLESPKAKKGSPGGEQKRSFLRSPFSRRKRSGSTSSTSGSAKEQSPTQKQHTRPESQPKGSSQSQAKGCEVSTQEGGKSTSESVYQHSNLLYRKGSTSSSSSSSIQSPRDLRLLDASRFGVKREKSPSPGPASGPPLSPSGITPLQYHSRTPGKNGTSGAPASCSKQQGGSRIPSFYSGPKRRSLTLSDGPDICSDSSSEGGRTRRANSDGRRSNGSIKSSCSKSRVEQKAAATLKKAKQPEVNRGQGDSNKREHRSKQVPKLTIPTGNDNQRTNDTEGKSQGRGQAGRSATGSRLPVNVRSSIGSPPKSPRSPGSSSPRSPKPPPDVWSTKSQQSESGRVRRSSQGFQEETNGSVRRSVSQESHRKEQKQKSQKENGTVLIGEQDNETEKEKTESLSAMSVGSDTSTTSVESKRRKEPSQDKGPKIQRSTSGSTAEDSSEYDDQDMAEQKSEMFVRNSANRSSLSERMKGLGRDVKKKISRLKPNRVSRDADQILRGSTCEDEGRTSDEAKHSNLGCQAVSSSSGHSSLSQDEPEPLYKGPFVGRAKVIRDYTPSPYDREALTLKEGDVILIISMNETGMWRGMVGNRVGTFKFINVEMLPPESPRASPIKRQPRPRGPRRPRPRTVHDLLQRLGLQHLTTVFLLHGFHTLELFSELEAEDLDELCISQPEERAKILTAAQLLVDYDNTYSPESGTGSRPQTPGGTAITPAGSTLTLTEYSVSTEHLAQDNTTQSHGVGGRESPLRTKSHDTASYLQAALESRDSGCYASSETLQNAEGIPRLTGEPPLNGADKPSSQREAPGLSPLVITSDTAPSSDRTEEMQPGSNTEAAEAVTDTVTDSVPVLSSSPGSAHGHSATCQRLPSVGSTAPSEPDTTDRDDASVLIPSVVQESTAADSPRGRIKPCVPMRRTSGIPMGGVESPHHHRISQSDYSDGASDACELSPARRSRAPGQAQRLSSNSSQTLSPCGSPTRIVSPIGSPHQIRSQSLPGSPLRSHSPGLFHSPPRPQSPLGLSRPPQHRYLSTPNVPCFRRARPKVPERTSSLPQTFGSTESITSATQTQQIIYAENGIQPTLPGHMSVSHMVQNIQNGHAQMRRCSSPAIRTFMSYTPPGSPQRSKLPTANSERAGTLTSRPVTRHESILSKRRPKPVSVTLEALVVAKMEADCIDLEQLPYTDESGFCGIPPALVQRYGEELRRDVGEIALALDECRIRYLQNSGRPAVPNDFLADSCTSQMLDIAMTTVKDFLISTGMPMYHDLLLLHNINSLDAVKEMREPDWKKIGVADPRHLRRLVQSTELLRARLAHSDKQKQMRILKLSQIRDKV